MFEYDFKEIAEELGLSVREVKNAYNSGMNKLRGCPSNLALYLNE